MRHRTHFCASVSLVLAMVFSACRSIPESGIVIDPEVLERLYICEPPEHYRVFLWLYGSLPLWIPEQKEYAPPERSVLYRVEQKRESLDYSLTLLLGTLFSVTTYRLAVWRCHSQGQQEILLQKEQDRKWEQEKRREEAQKRALEQEQKVKGPSP
ncbi:MAG: hypothetical protein KDK37_16055 [Leptospiraceae bacterium]|nr:hypothetical protein [Leptospiraceae bacterium]